MMGIIYDKIVAKNEENPCATCLQPTATASTSIFPYDFSNCRAIARQYALCSVCSTFDPFQSYFSKKKLKRKNTLSRPLISQWARKF